MPIVSTACARFVVELMNASFSSSRAEFFLSQIPLFSGLPMDEIRHLAATLDVRLLPPRHVLFYENDPSRGMYVVLDGHLQVLKALDSDAERVMAEFRAGQFVGEMGLLNPDGQRTATVRTVEPTLVMEVTRHDFDALLERHPKLAYGMVREMSARLTNSGNRAIADLQAKNRELEHAYTELADAYENTLEGWARALELRDQETEGHTRRVTEGTVLLARRLDITDDALRYMRWGAIVHDIGKIGIPDSILLKPGRLTDEERLVMQTHTQHAYDMLYPITFLRPAIDIPHYHHEKWDGTGYPRGLRGPEIPLAARIFAFLDVWDALTSERPYKQAWPLERARDLIVTDSGRHFDPDITPVFLEIIPDLQRIRADIAARHPARLG